MGVALGVDEGVEASAEGVTELGVLTADGETGAALARDGGDEEPGRGDVAGTGDVV